MNLTPANRRHSPVLVTGFLTYGLVLCVLVGTRSQCVRSGTRTSYVQGGPRLRSTGSPSVLRDWSPVPRVTFVKLSSPGSAPPFLHLNFGKHRFLVLDSAVQ